MSTERGGDGSANTAIIAIVVIPIVVIGAYFVMQVGFGGGDDGGNEDNGGDGDGNGGGEAGGKGG